MNPEEITFERLQVLLGNKSVLEEFLQLLWNAQVWPTPFRSKALRCTSFSSTHDNVQRGTRVSSASFLLSISGDEP